MKARGNLLDTLERVVQGVYGTVDKKNIEDHGSRNKNFVFHENKQETLFNNLECLKKAKSLKAKSRLQITNCMSKSL